MGAGIKRRRRLLTESEGKIKLTREEGRTLKKQQLDKASTEGNSQEDRRSTINVWNRDPKVG